ncbi:hypothetical protein [Burkholderia catarinensis]|uniref:hypothetical protein n=1 Tax=Burkholderia catarinensis TaxID=1108140 RepID=UPI0010086375|nr:hypothetical protein [Burkholderia catarinensis]
MPERAPLPSSVHGGMRCRDERGSAAAHQQGFVNPGSRASGTSGAFYLARSVPMTASLLEEIFNSLKTKGIVCALSFGDDASRTVPL